MANVNSSIEWTDATWNPATGCDRVSAGCDHCYALDLAARLKAMGNVRYQNDGKPTTSGPGFGVTMHADVVGAPLRWTKPRRVFVNSMSDLFHPDVPDHFVASVFAVMALAPQHTFQVLTKRPRRMERFVTALVEGRHDAAVAAAIEEHYRDEGRQRVRVRSLDDWLGWPLPNVWLGTSVENQEAAYRIDWLVRTPAAVRFLSCEPLLGPLDLTRWLWEGAGPEWAGRNPSPDLGWVIVGGESGPNFRPLNAEWARDLRDQCVEAQVPFFFKQYGGRTPKAGGRLLDGREWNEMPIPDGQAVPA